MGENLRSIYALTMGTTVRPTLRKSWQMASWEPSESSYHLIAEEASPKFASELRRLLPDYRLKKQFVEIYVDNQRQIDEVASFVAFNEVTLSAKLLQLLRRRHR